MKRVKVRLFLFSSLMLMALVPLAGAYWQIQDVLNSSFSMSREDETIVALEEGQEALKKLAKLTPSEESTYRDQFMKIQTLKLNLAEKSMLREHFVNSFAWYFFSSVVVVMLISLTLAFLLSHRVSRAYDKNLEELMLQKEKGRFLESMAHWQGAAKQLAHELKSPLQPIGLWMKNLVHAFEGNQSQKEFSSLLREAHVSVGEEIQHLHKMVDSFTQFSKLPEINLKPLDMRSFVLDFRDRYQDIWDLDWNVHVPAQPLWMQADPNLLRQVLTNLMNNAIEANPGNRIQVQITLLQEQSQLSMVFENTGAVLEEKLGSQIFEPYFTTKSGSANFGLGLSIVRKIILDHGGDIQVEKSPSGAKFRMTFLLIGEELG